MGEVSEGGGRIGYEGAEGEDGLQGEVGREEFGLQDGKGGAGEVLEGYYALEEGVEDRGAEKGAVAGRGRGLLVRIRLMGVEEAGMAHLRRCQAVGFARVERKGIVMCDRVVWVVEK